MEKRDTRLYEFLSLILHDRDTIFDVSPQLIRRGNFVSIHVIPSLQGAIQRLLVHRLATDTGLLKLGRSDTVVSLPNHYQEYLATFSEPDTMYTFPQELIDAVIDQLHGTILFDNIVLKNAEDSERCFYTFLASKRTAGPAVRTLLVESDDEEWDIAVDSCLECIPSLFPNLQTAKLSRMNWNYFPALFLTALFSAPQLQSVVLKDVGILDLEGFYAFLRRCSGMKDPLPSGTTLTSPSPVDAELEGFPPKLLEVRCTAAPTPPSFVLPVSHLRSIAFDLGDIPGMPMCPIPILRWWIYNFQAQSNQVEEITIRVYLDIASGELKERSAPQWRELDRVLLTRAPKLRMMKVILALRNEGYDDLMIERQRVIMDNLKGLRKRHVELEFRMVLQSGTDDAESRTVLASDGEE
ncbi:hypothetical protein DFS33DRAFT_1277727 [Desarmillaria ectypa]|nr:hypothetical protein DFS33DRAFT_1277727 [Desarmillaria ectypa]